jgi:hypothetical protein
LRYITTIDFDLNIDNEQETIQDVGLCLRIVILWIIRRAINEEVSKYTDIIRDLLELHDEYSKPHDVLHLWIDGNRHLHDLLLP